MKQTTKSDLKSQKVAELRRSVKLLFEDPEGDFDDMTKAELQQFVDDNWDVIAETFEESEDPKELKDEFKTKRVTDLYVGPRR